MGWCSATVIFDDVVGALIGDTKLSKKATIKKLAEALEDGDWDCQQDSAYWDHPIVQRVFKELHPHWFEEDK